MTGSLIRHSSHAAARQPGATFTLDIGTVVVETDAERDRVEAAAPALQQAFLLLAEKLGRTPFHQFGEIGQRMKGLAADPVRIPDFPIDELLSPRGVERLADELYRQLLRRTE